MSVEYKNPIWLCCRYWGKGFSQRKIAKICDVSEITIRRYCKKFKIPLRSRSDAMCLARDISGENNPNWRGGTWDEQDRFYWSREWRELRRKVFARDKVCQRCGSKENLRPHHKKSWEVEESRLDPDNVITLCQACHVAVHTLMDPEFICAETFPNGSIRSRIEPKFPEDEILDSIGL